MFNVDKTTALTSWRKTISNIDSYEGPIFWGNFQKRVLHLLKETWSGKFSLFFLWTSSWEAMSFGIVASFLWPWTDSKHKLAIYSSITAGGQFGTGMCELFIRMGISTRRTNENSLEQFLLGSKNRRAEDEAPEFFALHYKRLSLYYFFLSHVWIFWWDYFLNFY